MNRKYLLAIPVLLVGIFGIGCEPKDVDPQQKVDAPGYYNGPMKSKADKADEAGAKAQGSE
jgi:hypothetical protein